MVQAYDHRASDVVLADQNLFRTGQGQELTVEEHQNPIRAAAPRYWVQADKLPWHTKTEWCVAIKDVTSVTNARTTIATIIPRAAAGHTLPVIFPASAGRHMDQPDYVDYAFLLTANLNSFLLDYLARQKVHGNHLAWYQIEQLPFVLSASYDRKFGPKSAREIIREAVLELTYTSNDMMPFARDMRYLDSDGSVICAVPRSHEEGRFGRSPRTLGAGCDGRLGVARRATRKRTAKPCGPVPPTLGSSFATDLQSDGG